MIGSVPVHVPFAAVSVLPTSAVPEIVGGAVLFGTAAEAARPGPVSVAAAVTAAIDTTPIARSVSRRGRRRSARVMDSTPVAVGGASADAFPADVPCKRAQTRPERFRATTLRVPRVDKRRSESGGICVLWLIVLLLVVLAVAGGIALSKFVFLLLLLALVFALVAARA